jgi:hypothetical protein
MARLGFIVATNNDEILEKNLLNSKVIRDRKYPVTIQRGYHNIGKAYNEGMAKTDAEILVCLHQDVFLPDDWENKMLAALSTLERSNWGVLGAAGVRLVRRETVYLGHVLDRGRKYGSPENLPVVVDTLDELLLVVRNDRRLLFDERIPTAHFYGADICLQSSGRGLRCFAISAYCHHNSIGSNHESPEFKMAAQYMQKKWRRRLPFATTCTIVESRSEVVLRRILIDLRLKPLAHATKAALRRLVGR